MKNLVSTIDNKLYPNFTRNWDDELFRNRILANIKKDLKVLDLGAGAGIVPQMNFKGMVQQICGVDPDQRVETNPYLDEGKVGIGEAIPYPQEYFDIVFADNVFEHLSSPEEVLTEINRILKPGGLLLAKTPNKNHYMPLIARLTPHRFHQFINKLRGRAEVDTFPTLYRINTPQDVNYYASLTGFSVSNIELIEGRPEYLRFNILTYLIGIAYEKLVNKFTFLSKFRILLIISLQKPL